MLLFNFSQKKNLQILQSIKASKQSYWIALKDFARELFHIFAIFAVYDRLFFNDYELCPKRKLSNELHVFLSLKFLLRLSSTFFFLFRKFCAKLKTNLDKLHKKWAKVEILNSPYIFHKEKENWEMSQS